MAINPREAFRDRDFRNKYQRSSASEKRETVRRERERRSGSGSQKTSQAELNRIADQALSDAGITQSGGLVGSRERSNREAADKIIDWATSIGEDPRSQNTLQSAFGIKQRPELNPNTGFYEDRLYKEVSPMSIALGLAGGLPGMLASVLAEKAGVSDPLAFDIAMPFAGDASPTTLAKRERGDDDRKKPAETAQQTVEKKAAKPEKEQPEFGDTVKKAMAETEFEFGQMPDFQILNDVFGVDLAEILSKPKTNNQT